MPEILSIVVILATLQGCLPELPWDKGDPNLITPPPAPAGIRKTPLSFAVGLMADQEVKGLKMEVFNTGTILTRGESVSAIKSYHAKIKMDVPVFLIRHPVKGNILFGTGLSADPEKRRHSLFSALLPGDFRYKQKRKRDIVSQLSRVGVAAEDISYIILPFLDIESAGMLSAFPAAAVLVSAREWGFATAAAEKDLEKKGWHRPDEIAKSSKIELVDLANAPAFGPFENAVDYFKDGSIFLVGLPGRTPGMMGAWIGFDDGPVLLAGGAAYVVDNYLDLALPVAGRVGDLDEYWRTLHIINAAARDVPRLVVVPGNDLTTLKISARESVVLRREK